MMFCPRCDGHGVIWKGVLENSKGVLEKKYITLYICDECEATWLDKNEVELSNFRDLTALLKEEYGLTYIEAKIENCGYYF